MKKILNQGGEISYQDALAPKVYFIFAFKVIQHCSNSLSWSSCKIGNVLLGKPMFDQHFQANFSAIVFNIFFQKFYNSLSCIFGSKIV